jgi:hypothetical protein
MLATALSLALWLGTAAPETEAARVQRVARLLAAEAERDGAVAPAVLDGLAAVVLAQTGPLVGDARAVTDARLDTPQFAAHVRASVAQFAAPLDGTRGPARRLLLDDLLRRATTTDLPGRVIDAWFGLPSPPLLRTRGFKASSPLPSSPLPSSPLPSSPLSSLPSTSSSSASAVAPDLPSGGPVLAGAVAASASPTTAPGIDDEAAVVAGVTVDGTDGAVASARPGAGAGAPRPTEQMVLALQLGVPPSSGPLSLEPLAASLVDELGAGGQNGVLDAGEWALVRLPVRNRGTLRWFSASARVVADGACLWTDPTPTVLDEIPPGGAVPLKFWVYVAADCSPEAARAVAVQIADTLRGISGASLRLALTPFVSPRLRLANARLDTDDLGGSDGSNAVVLGPTTRAEYAVDVVADGALAGGRLAFAAPVALGQALPRFLFAADAPLADDGKGLWRGGDDLDLTLAPEDILQTTVADAAAVARWLGADAADPKKQGRLWLAIDVTVDAVVPKALRIDPAESDGGRTEDGRTEGGRTEGGRTEGGRTEGGRTDALRRARAEPASPPPTVTATRRLYTALASRTFAPPPPPPAPSPAPSPAPPPPPPPPPWANLQFGAGAGAAVYTHVVRGAPRVFALPGAQVRVVGGTGAPAGIVSVSTAGMTFSKLGRVRDFAMQELQLELGALWRFDLEVVEASPCVTVGLRHRWSGDPLGGARPDQTLPMLAAGGIVRRTIVDQLSAYADVGLVVGGAGPVVSSHQVDGVPVVDSIDPVGGRISVGVSWRF